MMSPHAVFGAILQACGGLLSSIQDGKKYVSIFAQRGEEWKKSRQLISPAFSTHKLKLVRN